MDGLLVIDKPEGITSHDVVARVRRILKTKRVGHTGTLDPLATGVMVVMVGKATRLAQFLDKDTKEYIATVRFGFETDTGDRTGSPKSKAQSPNSVSIAEIEVALPEFRGELMQTPPMYSAKKVEGKRLYELARKGVEIERKPTKVTIHELEVIDSLALKSEPGAVATGSTAAIDQVILKIVCSAGTYVRTLAEDIGRRLKTGAHLTALRRTGAGAFRIEDSVTLDAFEELEDSAAVLRPIREATESLPVFELREDRIEKTKNGMSTRDLSGRFKDREYVQMIDPSGELIAVGYYDESEKAVQPKIVLV